MVAIGVRLHCEDSRDSGYIERKVPRQKIGLDHELNAGRCVLATRRCTSLCMEGDLALEKATPLSSQVRCLDHLENIKAILDSLDTVLPSSAGSIGSPEFESPPSYNDSIADQPPSYDSTGDLALSQAARYYPVPPPAYFYKSATSILPPDQISTPGIGFGDTSNFRQAGNKKKEKQQKKQAGAAKWNNEGGEGNAEGGEGGEENGGGGAGGGNNGDGGAGDDGGGGDDWDAWNSGKRKKGKKAKDEEKKKQDGEEEEEEEEEEKKRKEEEEPNRHGRLDWADDANGDVGGDWGTFTTTTTKKGKKEKKGKSEPAANGTGGFADINLNDNVPKIDLSFDSIETKDTGEFNSFAGWGGGGSTWNTGSNWNFGGADTATTDIADSFSRTTKESTTDTTDNSTWSFGGNKKNQKKKTNTRGFDFGNFGALDEEKEDQEAEEDTVEGNNHWETFPAAGEKDNKPKKKGTFNDVNNDPDSNTIGTALPDPGPTAEDSWGAWGNSSSKKKKGKKGEDDVLPPRPPAAAVYAPTEPAAEEWGGFGTKKGGNKGKKITEVDEPAVAVVPEWEPRGDAGWGTFGKKEKSKKELEVEEPDITGVPDPNLGADAGWSSLDKKVKKKNGKKEPEKIEDQTAAVLPDPGADLDFAFGSFGKSDDKKSKKGKKEPDRAAEPTTTALEGSEPNVDFGIGAWGKKEDKKGKKGKKEPDKTGEPTVTALPDTELDLDLGFSSFGKKDDKKGKKGKKDEKTEGASVTIVPEQEPEVDIGWGSFVKKEVKKKGKKDIDKTEEASAKEPNPEPIGDWGSFSTKNDKDKKKSKKSNMWDEPEEEEDHNVMETPEQEINTGWAAFDSKKDKRKGTKDAVEKINSTEPIVEEKPDLARTGSTKAKKGQKGPVSETKEDPMPALESRFATDTANVAANGDWASGFGTDKKKDKKNKRNSLASTGSRGDEPPPPPVPNVPDASSFDVWDTAKKDKDKDKKGKKGKVTEPELISAPEPEETKDIVEDEYTSWAGLSARDRKKKEKEKEKKDREAKEARDKEEAEEKERREKEEAEEREREEKAKKEKDKSKGKIGKKGKSTTSPEISKTNDLLAESIPDVVPVAEGDNWGSTWGPEAFKKDMKKGGRKEMFWDAPPHAPTPPAQGLTPEPEEDVEENTLDNQWDGFPPAKTAMKGKKEGKKGIKDKITEVVDDTSKKSAKGDLKKDVLDDTAAKAAKGFWGGMGATSASKSKTSAKDKEKVAKEAKEADGEGEDNDNDYDYDYDYDDDDYDDDDNEDDDVDAMMMEMIDEEPTTNPTAKDGKLSKMSTKDSDKASKGSSVAKKKGGMTVGGKMMDDEKKVDMDVFSAWASSSSKKTTGKKGDEDVWGKKEIAAKDLTNQKSTGWKGISNEREATEKDDQPSTLQPSKPFHSAMSTSKSLKTSSVLQRVKEIEKEKNSKASFSALPDPDPEPTSKFDKKAGATSKPKDSAASVKSPASKTKDWTPDSKNREASKEEAVPGSFPGEGMDDDFNNLDDLLDNEAPPEKKETKKSIKTNKDSKLMSKTPNVPESKPPPTPPPEAKEEKPVKKERPRIAKEGGASSWGLWGAAPPKKKETKSKDDADILSPSKKEKAATPGFSRSKSTRTTKEKDKETVKSDPKSSDSDKPKKKESRPPKSRGTSFGALFGGGPPARTKSVRKNSTAASITKSAASRRQSLDVDATGLPSPPAEEAPEMAAKAAKMMGTAKLDRKASTRGKQKATGKKLPVKFEISLETADSGNVAVPDPYTIDSDDMVMVNGLDDSLANGKPSATKGKGSRSEPKGTDAESNPPLRTDLPDRTKSKRDSKMDPSSSKRKPKTGNDFDDDVVMVDAGSSGDANVEPGPDDMQFVTKPKGLQRSATSSKKPDVKFGGLGGGLFGAFRKNRRASEVNVLPKSRAIVEDEEVAPRKRTVTGGDDSAKRPRRNDRRRSEKTERAAEGYVYDAARDVGGATEAEDVDARREKRRTKRVEDDRIAKEQREEALRYEADRRAKRREADKAKLKDDRDRRARKDEEAEARRLEDKDARRAAREARRREEEANRALEDDILKPRSKRRDTDKEVPAASASRPRTSDRRRSHVDRVDDRPKSSRRKSTMAPVDDYFDSRNGRPVNGNDPYGGNDHTASWVKSQVSEPPEPPPVEPTIMEAAPDLRSKGADDLMEDEYARRASHKKPKRSSHMYTDPLADEQEERRRRRKGKEVRSSEGSAAEERYGGLGSMNLRPSDLGGVKLGAGTKTFDGKTGQGKRSSWFQKVTGGF